MNNKNIFAFVMLCCISSTLFCGQTPELSYWQQFKNWISGKTSYAQTMAEVPYEWAQNFINGLSRKQKIALALTFGNFSRKMLNRYTEDAKLFPHGVGIEVIGGFGNYIFALIAADMIDSYLHAVDVKYTIKQLKIDLQDTQKFPTLQSKIDILKIMQAAYGSERQNPNKIALQAVNTVLDELLKEKKQ